MAYSFIEKVFSLQPKVINAEKDVADAVSQEATAVERRDVPCRTL
jgi:hypothetical protein